MYLAQVLSDIRRESAPPKSLHAEHLFKLNEAVFNLPEEDVVDAKTALRLFQTVQSIRTAYTSGKYDNADANFFYDYLALLGTMQNQHFFSQKQTEKMLGWIKDIIDEEGIAGAEAPASTSGAKALASENEKLRARLAKYEELQGAVEAIRSFDLEAKAKAKGKAKPEPAPAKGKGKGAPEPAEPETAPKGKGKGKKGKAPPEEEEEEPPAKGKGKGKKGKKGKGTAEEEDEEDERPPLRGKSKGKGGKGGKGDTSPDESPSPKAGKGKGKGAKGKGKTSGSAWKPK